jgi:DNA-binding transcriptional LysR family regulator
VRASDMGRGLRSAFLGEIDYALYVPKSLLPGGKQLPTKQLLEKLPICTLTGEPSFREQLEASLENAGVRCRLRRVVETFPQICDAVLTGCYAAVLPTFARDLLPPSHFLELKDPVLGKHDTKLNLVWMPRLERQRPAVAALVPTIVERMQRHHRERGR